MASLSSVFLTSTPTHLSLASKSSSTVRRFATVSSSQTDPLPPPSPSPSLASSSSSPSPSHPLHPLFLSLPSPSSNSTLVTPRPVVGRRCLVNRSTVAAASVLGLVCMERREARAALATTCDLVTSSSGLEYCDSVVGSGVQAEKGMLIKAHYTGKLLDGTVFDSSYNRGRPLVFRVGVGEVIKGWDQGILGTTDIPAMLAGGRRSLKIPADLAYGARGAGCRGATCVIPPNSTLLFDVEFVGKA